MSEADDWRQTLQKLREVYNWTPRQVCQEITIPQLTAIFLKDAAEGKRPVSLEEGIELLRQRAREKAATKS